MLTHQGRMHQEIAEFPNIEFYGGKLSVVPLPHQTLPTGTDELTKLKTQNSKLKIQNGIVRMLNAHRIAFIASPHVDNTTAMKTNQAEAEMIAASILRARTRIPAETQCQHEATTSDIALGFTGHQRVHTNPSQQEGVSV
jgi:hypothetical protein